jgi:hypothetical protein
LNFFLSSFAAAALVPGLRGGIFLCAHCCTLSKPKPQPGQLWQRRLSGLQGSKGPAACGPGKCRPSHPVQLPVPKFRVCGLHRLQGLASSQVHEVCQCRATHSSSASQCADSALPTPLCKGTYSSACTVSHLPGSPSDGTATNDVGLGWLGILEVYKHFVPLLWALLVRELALL